MFRRIICFCVAFLFLCPNLSFSSQSVSAETGILIENTSGKILWEKNAYKKMPMASTTKIMTAICAIENLDTEKMITVDDRAIGTEGSSMYLKKGEILSLGDLLYGLMLNSGNDAACAIAYAVSGSIEGFCSLMNETAKKIGAHNTNFKNPSGLYEEDHYTTAYDLALISAYAMKNPVFYSIVSQKEKNIATSDGEIVRSLRNHNKLLWRYDGCIGVKTGYTKKCGRCLVTSAKRGMLTLTCVTLNAPDDWNDHTNLLNYGFSKCTSLPIAEKNSYAKTYAVSDGVCDMVGTLFKEDLVAVSKGEDIGKIEVKFSENKKISAPIKKGDVLGKAQLYVSGKLFSQTELVANTDVLKIKKKSFSNMLFSSIKEYLSLYKHIEKLYNCSRQK